jgi:plasmid stabilization system protein ParE
MVRKIIWSANAKADRIEILDYWIKRNKSNTYSKKLNLLFREAINLVAKNPTIGHVTIKENVRVKIVKQFLIIYEITVESINIHSIFDNRRDPEEFIKRL